MYLWEMTLAAFVFLVDCLMNSRCQQALAAAPQALIRLLLYLYVSTDYNRLFSSSAIQMTQAVCDNFVDIFNDCA